MLRCDTIRNSYSTTHYHCRSTFTARGLRVQSKVSSMVHFASWPETASWACTCCVSLSLVAGDGLAAVLKCPAFQYCSQPIPCTKGKGNTASAGPTGSLRPTYKVHDTCASVVGLHAILGTHTLHNYVSWFPSTTN